MQTRLIPTDSVRETERREEDKKGVRTSESGGGLWLAP
jgi:hypothetical protein